MQKFVILLTAILGFVACSSYAQSHHSFWGTVGESDTRVLNRHVRVNRKWFGTVTQDVVFPDQGYSNDRLITAIRAYDQKTNGNGAYAAIESGGMDSNQTIVHFQSKKGHGIDFILEIYVE